MREILFRGKRIANDEWVSGYYVARKRPYFKGKGADFEHIICDNLVIDDFNDKQFVDTIPITYSVDPKTIGQYTGLTDTNGNKIFEGDLCLCDRNISKHIDKKVFEIKFDPETGFFGESDTSNICPSDFYMCEIIGNVFDTPEFLEAGVAP
uniref:YopX family protein n=1 Tax=Ruminococcus bicirculans (ex Wegman et al. 2014) TaxID=1160721 RepID=UPI004029CC25